jgi:molybdopterin converting factor small subunit
MKPTFNDKLIAYLVLLSGLAISGVAEYYSIMGLMAIYPAAIIPIVIMGVVLGIGKISGTVWLKQNWEWSPFFLKAYVLPAIVVLMLITSLGVFGFLSKAHSDQSLVSGDVQSKIAVYDTKIQTSKDNIDANRKALKQLDEAVDQVMGRSSDEKGADKAVAIRRAQQKERIRLQSEIAAEQKTIATINEERAPVAAEVRKVEAEVGPIKYIAHLLYGENPDANILEKAVIWVTVLIVIVLDPLAVVLLLASQYSFQRFRELEQEDTEEDVEEWFRQAKERARQLDEERANEILKAGVTNSNSDDATPIAEGDSPTGPDVDVISTDTTVTTSTTILESHPYLLKPFSHFTDTTPIVAPRSTSTIEYQILEDVEDEAAEEAAKWAEENNETAEAQQAREWAEERRNVKNLVEQFGYTSEKGIVRVAGKEYNETEFNHLISPGYVQNEEQEESGTWNKVISEQEYREQVKEKIKNDSKNNSNNAT